MTFYRLSAKALFAFFTTFFVLAIIFSAVFYTIDTKTKANTYLLVAKYIDDNRSEDSINAIKYYKKSIQTYKKIGDEPAALEAYIRLGLLHYRFGNSVQVEKMVLKAMQVGQNNIPKKMQARIFLLLATTTEPKKAKKYLNTALEISTQINALPLIAESYYLQGLAYEYKADFKNAEESYLKGIEVTRKMSITDVFDHYDALYENLAELYAGGGEVAMAIDIYEELLNKKIYEERGFSTANYMKKIGDLYHEHSEPPRGKPRGITSGYSRVQSAIAQISLDLSGLHRGGTQVPYSDLVKLRYNSYYKTNNYYAVI